MFIRSGDVGLFLHTFDEPVFAGTDQHDCGLIGTEIAWRGRADFGHDFGHHHAAFFLFGGEQEANAKRVERIGAGIALDRARLTPEHVRAAFARLRGDDGFKARATDIATATAGTRGAETAARLIRELTARGTS